MKDNAKDIIKELCEKLNEYRDAYYNTSSPLVEDGVYDTLYDKLILLEKETGIVYANSPTQTVGYPILKDKKKVNHVFPLLSMDKTKDIDEFKKFFSGRRYVLSLKLDGLTTELFYEDGALKEASTRGNGLVGEEITDFLNYFTNVPVKIPFRGKLRLVGESIIHLDDFEKINAPLPKEEQYANARNLVSGSFGLLDTVEFAKRKVSWYCFNVLEIEGVELRSLADSLDYVKEMGFEICPRIIRNCTEETENEIEFLKEVATFNKLGIDGIVGRFDDMEYGKSLGVTAHHPLDSLAFKFYDELHETILRDIEWKTSKDGRMFPRAVFDTVTIDGTEVNFATLHNIRYIRELELGIGDTIMVSKRNQIIPAVEENITRSNTYELPRICTSCGKDVHITTIGNTEYLVCHNTMDCKAQKVQFFKRLVSRDALNIDGVSEATIETLIEGKALNRPKDLWNFERIKEVLSKTDGFGEKSIENLIGSLTKARETHLSNFIYSLSIPLIGKVASKTIADFFRGDFESFLNLGERTNFVTLKDFGPTMAESMEGFFKEEIDWVKELAKEMIFIKEETKEANDFINGKVFCVTGAFSKFTRKELEKIITDGGGRLTGSVTSKTNYLLTNDKESGSSKNIKAKELGTPILNEEEFLRESGVE